MYGRWNRRPVQGKKPGGPGVLKEARMATTPQWRPVHLMVHAARRLHKSAVQSLRLLYRQRHFLQFPKVAARGRGGPGRAWLSAVVLRLLRAHLKRGAEADVHAVLDAIADGVRVRQHGDNAHAVVAVAAAQRQRLAVDVHAQRSGVVGVVEVHVPVHVPLEHVERSHACIRRGQHEAHGQLPAVQ
jgi:hypothetical protein